MKLRGIDFGTCLNASGARGFFGEGYWYHSYAPGLTYEGVTFVSKTTTLNKREGNMAMKEDGITPAKLVPDCIKVDPFKGVALNAVGLSGPGLVALLDDGRWQQRTSPFLISVMSVAGTVEERLYELSEIATFLKSACSGRYAQWQFRTRIGLEVNWSCPNAGLDPTNLICEVKDGMHILGKIGVPLVHKFNALVPPAAIVELSHDDHFDAVCVSNTIPWFQQVEWTDELPPIEWEKLFGSPVSPLAKYGGGGLSGKALLPIVECWLKTARASGIRKPMVGCGGIYTKDAAKRIRAAGACAMELGSIAFTRPWKMKKVIEATRRWH